MRDAGILLIGSGELTHNFAPTTRAQNLQFSEAVQKLLEDGEMSSEQRYMQLVEWEKLPNARRAHAQEDHFVPLFVMVGASGGAAGKRVIEADMGFNGMNFIADSYLFE